MALTTVPFDAAPYLEDPQAQAELLDQALRSGDASYIDEALSVIARSRGLSVTETRNEVPVDSDPRLSTLLRVARDLGVRLHVTAAAAE